MLLSNRFVTISTGVALSAIIAGVLTHFFVKSPIDPVAFQLGAPLPFIGFMEVNHALSNATFLLDQQVYGPESIAIHPKTGLVYTGLKTGLICEIEVKKKTAKILRAVRVTGDDSCDGSYASFSRCGRPLGLRFHPTKHTLYVADAYKGLFEIDFKTEKVKQLIASAGGTKTWTDFDKVAPVRYINDVEFMKDGRVVMTESSWKFDDRDCLLDLLEHRSNGRLLLYNPEDDTLHVIVDDLYFPNGLVVRDDDVFISEMGMSRILKYSLSRQKMAVFSDKLPGYPDNIRMSRSGEFLIVPIPTLRTESDDWLAQRPALRSLLLIAPQRLADVLSLFSQPYGLVLLIDANSGHIVDALHDPTGKLSEISHVAEMSDGSLLFGSDSNYFIGKVNLPKDRH